MIKFNLRLTDFRIVQTASIAIVAALTCASCAQSTVHEPKKESPVPQATTAMKEAETTPITAPETAPSDTPKPATPVVALTPPAAKDEVWTMTKSKVRGPGPAASPKLVSKTKNSKTPGHTTVTCWHYGDFAVLETRSSDEIGAAELKVHEKSEGNPGLCREDFKGKVLDLKIREGYFAGVAGDFVLVDGAEFSEGLQEFQVFSVATGQEVYRSSHHPDREFQISRRGKRSSLIFYAKIEAKCPLAQEGQACWGQILKAGKVPPTLLPDCKTSFAKTKTPLTENVQVTVRAQVADLNKPVMKYLGGHATCQPAP